jgi:hypothetical protein
VTISRFRLSTIAYAFAISSLANQSNAITYNITPHSVGSGGFSVTGGTLDTDGFIGSGPLGAHLSAWEIHLTDGSTTKTLTNINSASLEESVGKIWLG